MLGVFYKIAANCLKRFGLLVSRMDSTKLSISKQDESIVGLLVSMTEFQSGQQLLCLVGSCPI